MQPLQMNKNCQISAESNVPERTETGPQVPQNSLPSFVSSAVTS